MNLRFMVNGEDVTARWRGDLDRFLSWAIKSCREAHAGWSLVVSTDPGGGGLRTVSLERPGTTYPVS